MNARPEHRALATELTVVIPTYNEHDNIRPLYTLLCEALTGIDWEMIIVDDDSPDATWQAAQALSREDARVRCLRRIDRRGLASAYLEGALASSSPFIAVMDADLQHDERLLPDMLRILRQDEADIVIGSRYVGNGSTGSLHADRVRISRLATRLGQLALAQPVTDPMSGFFMTSRGFLEERIYRLQGQGFKILLDLLGSQRSPARIRELPYVMRARQAGESKLDTQVIWDYLSLLARRIAGRWLPETFLLFALVGLSGVAVHMTVLTLANRYAELGFLPSQSLAAFVAMTSNFLLNNRITFRHQRLRGIAFIRGLFRFYLYCSVGAVIGISASEFLYELPTSWWFAGLSSTLISAVWNYMLNASFTWRSPPRSHAN